MAGPSSLNALASSVTCLLAEPTKSWTTSGDFCLLLVGSFLLPAGGECIGVLLAILFQSRASGSVVSSLVAVTTSHLYLSKLSEHIISWWLTKSKYLFNVVVLFPGIPFIGF